ncbi:hypothetical protein FACS189485_22020 [Spirochaetia bacterium]|nr:hypothetical protein FACS189485_22020 [Spirochaetia bacterium]
MDNPFQLILDRLDQIENEVINTRVYTVKDIAKLQGYSAGNMYQCPWRLPNFGRPDIGDKPGKWLYRTVMDWLKIPEDERREKWDFMNSDERRKAMGRK